MTTENSDDEVSNFDSLSICPSEASTSRGDVVTDKYGFIGGKEYTNPESEVISVETVREREIKWLSMLDHWDKWISKRFPMVKRRCRKGIPSSLRGRAWQLLCGSKQLQMKNKDVYQNLLRAEASTQTAEDIEKDLHRQFPFHEMFLEQDGTGQQDLRDILHAYAIYNSRDGYCQAQAPVAAVLLMHMPAEEAFWCMVALFERYIPGYYSPGLEAVQIDGDVMQGLLRHVSSTAYKHLDKYHVSPMLYCTEWLMCIFSRNLPWPCVLRLWDVFFCEGIKIVFRCALILLKSALGKAETIKSLSGMYETLEYLKKFDLKGLKPDVLIKKIEELRIEVEDLESEQKRQFKLRKKQNPQAKMARRSYRCTPAYYHFKSSSLPMHFRTKKKLSTVSVNTPQMIAQAAEQEQTKKMEKKFSSSKRKHSAPVVLTEYKRYGEHSTVSTNGDATSASSSGTSFLSNTNATAK